MKRKKAVIVILACALAAGYTWNGGAGAFQAKLVNAKETKSEISTRVVVNDKNEWKYLDNNTDPAEEANSLQAWTEKEFDDSTWKKAAGTFGAKKGELTEFDGFKPTVLLNQYKEDKTDIPTYFFRTTFEISDLEQITSITGSLFHDDAVAVYLNGHKIVSVDMPSKTQTSNMYYAGTSAGAPKKAEISLNAEQVKEYAVQGDNVLSVELHNDRANSSDIYFGFEELRLNYNEETQEQPVSQKSIILNVGSDETSRNLTWYANTEEAGEVQYAVKSGETFPEKYETVKAISNAANDPGFYSNQATLRNLAENTEYVYRVKNGEAVSEVYSFTTGDYDGSFSFALVGDPQIGTGDLQNGIDGWDETLDVIQTKLNPDFIMSAGDQVNTASNETEYAGYLNDTLASIPSASTVGNHDSKSNAYSQHFNLPNESADLGITEAGGDFWFVYNNTLFMSLNSNDRSTAEHKAFMEEAIAANPDVKWKNVVFHHSIYSTASHVDDSDIITRREELPQVFEELDIDVVLMGHDHVYTRTYMMDGFTPDTSNGVQSSVTDPTGILYLTANSASGSKYYDIKAADAEYAAKQDQSYRRTVTDIEVSDTSYKLTTYYADDMSVLDSFTINKTPEKDTDVQGGQTDQNETENKPVISPTAPDKQQPQTQPQTTGKQPQTTVNRTPKTGDATNAAAAGLLLVSATGAAVCLLRRKK